MHHGILISPASLTMWHKTVGGTGWKVCDGLPLNLFPYGRSNLSRIHFEYFESSFKLRTESFQTCLPSALVGLFWPTCSRLTGRDWEMYPQGFWTRKLEFQFSYLSHSCWLSCFPSMPVLLFPLFSFWSEKYFSFSGNCVAHSQP